VLFLVCSALSLQAQSTTDFERSRYSPAAFYNYAQPGDVTIVVNVWGTVRNPGLYQVTQGTRLSRLISLSGGPNLTPGRRREKRTISLNLIRGDAPILQETMEEQVTTTKQDPVLADGDVLTIEMTTQQRFGWRDIIPIVNTAALIALALERISNVN
jgi:protein involved in polysaccharide export with SLBB domain